MTDLELFNTSEQAQTFVKTLTELSKKLILDELLKITELEDKNYKIDKELSLEEKLKNGWKKSWTIMHGIGYELDDVKIDILRKDLGDKAYVWEYLDNRKHLDNEFVPKREYAAYKKYVGEQKFNRPAVEKLGLRDRMPKDYEEFRKIRGYDYEEFIKKYFKGVSEFSGTIDTNPRSLILFDQRGFFWLGDGSSILINDRGNILHHKKDAKDLLNGFSVRLTKQQ